VDVLTDFARYREWNPVMRIEGAPEVGTKLAVHVTGAGGHGMGFKPKCSPPPPARNCDGSASSGSAASPPESTSSSSAPNDGTTRLEHGERYSGPLVALAKGSPANSDAAYEAFSDALKERVEHPTKLVVEAATFDLDGCCSASEQLCNRPTGQRKELLVKITTIGRGAIGGTLGRLWTSAGHEVTELGRDGGDATDADVVLLAVPDEVVPDALASVTGLHGKIVLDATNRMGVVEHSAPAGYPSIAEYVKAQTGGPTAKAFNLTFGKLLDQAATASSRPNNIWVGDEGARVAVEQLSRDIGMEPLNGGPLENAAIEEEFAKMLMAIVRDAGDGPLFYRFAAPRNV
jgi:predicted dinucleotide-binding enzyme